MAVYRFRVTFEDYEDIYRDIDMPSKGTFLELHHEIHKSTGYNAEVSSSFYVSNDQWKKVF
jgi:predicted double-glycine peptidase